ncbi:MAG: family 20 glycosylhydrolase [Bacteroidota bacterium]
MRSTIFFKFIIFLCLIGCTKPDSPQEAITPIILPIPTWVGFGGPDFEFDKNVSFHTDYGLHKIRTIANTYFKEKLGYELTLQRNPDAKEFRIIFDPSITHDEGYRIEVEKDSLVIRTKTEKGAFYAFQSLRQFFPPSVENKTFTGEKILLHNALVEDAPRFKYRGMHLDVSRHMFSVDFIKKYIDLMSQLKMNTFHWHLTDDQGWRIEIKKYPKLQEVAAFRDETLIGHYNDSPQQFDGKKYGGYYTQEEVKDIVQYAAERYITVIPEIEMPGHAQAAIAAYPNLGCSDTPVKVATKWGVFEDIYCPTEETFTFLENVLDEVIALFPGKYIHIGGDEAPKTRWKDCAYCQELIKKENLQDEHGLQSYFITRMEKYVNSKGKQIIGWDEILEGGLAPNATVMSWRGMNGGIEAAKSGHNVIMTPTSHAYFDYYQSDNEDEPLAIGGYLPLEKVYNFEPIPAGLTKEQEKYILGAQGNVWTEYMATPEKVEYMAFPRMIAMAEVAWSQPERKGYEYFSEGLSLFHKRLDAQNVNYANHLYEIEGGIAELVSGDLPKPNDPIVLILKTILENQVIRYTTDASSPTINSKEYVTYVPVEESTIFKAAVFDEKKKLGRDFTLKFNKHKAVMENITLVPEPHTSYSGSGKYSLINGISGSDTRYGDKEWLGFWGDDVTITLDFDTPKKISTISTRFYNANGQWIYAPKEIQVSYINKDTGKREYQMVNITDNDATIVPYTLNIKETTIQSLEIRIPNYGTIPDGKQGAGNKAWTFLDEIVVE